MKSHPRIAEDVSFDHRQAPDGPPDVTAGAGAPGGHARHREPRPARELAERAGVYAIVLVTIVGLANALGLI
jgi:hypothetical protein